MIPGTGGVFELYVDDVLNQNIKLGLKVNAFQVENYICWGTPNDYKTYLYWQNFFEIGLKINSKKVVTFVVVILPADCTRRTGMSSTIVLLVLFCVF